LVPSISNYFFDFIKIDKIAIYLKTRRTAKVVCQHEYGSMKNIAIQFGNDLSNAREYNNVISTLAAPLGIRDGARNTNLQRIINFVRIGI